MKTFSIGLATALVATVATTYSRPAHGAIVGPWNGNYYMKVDRNVSWPEANWLASRAETKIDGRWWKGSLASVTSQEENDWVWANLKQPAGYWLGGWWNWSSTDNKPGWNWVSGDKWNWTNWGKGASTSASWGEDSFLAFGSDKGSWTWSDWSNRQGYIVKFTPK